MEKIVVVVEEVEVARTALNWALSNILRYGDVITLLHVYSATSKKKLRRLRLNGFQLALSFRDICDAFPNVWYIQISLSSLLSRILVNWWVILWWCRPRLRLLWRKAIRTDGGLPPSSERSAPQPLYWDFMIGAFSTGNFNSVKKNKLN